MKKITLLILAVSILQCGTESDQSVTDNRPVTKGLFITGETSSEAIATWRTPEEPTDIRSLADRFRMRNIYPNPSNGAMRISFTLPFQTDVRIWVDRARWENEDELEYPEPFIETLLEGNYEPGNYGLIWNNGFNCGGVEGRNLDEGFYRVYIETDDFYYWKDVYIAGSSENAPPGLGQYNSEEYCN